MAGADLLVIALYLAAIIAVNRYWAGRVDFAGWLTSKNTIGLGFLVFTVVSTNVGAGTIVGTVGKTMRSGLGWALTSGVGVMIGFWIMAALVTKIRRITPSGDRSSFSEFFRRRYGRDVQVTAGLLIALLYFFYLAAQFQALAGILNVWAGFGAESASVAAALLIVWLTASAGIKSDLYTDILHFWAMVITIGATAWIEIGNRGGLTPLVDSLRQSGQLDALLDPYRFGASDASVLGLPAGVAYVWLGIPVGALLGLPAYENWQRVDVAKTTGAAKFAFIWSGFINAAFFGIAALLGFVAAAALPADVPSNQALYRLIDTTLPVGLKGLAVVGIFAAIMSTANTMLMVAVSTLLGDLIHADRKTLKGEKHILATTRQLTWVVGIVAFVIAKWQADIVKNIMTALWGSGVLIPAIAGGLYWKRGTARAALVSIVLGFAVTTALSSSPSWSAISWIPGLGLAGIAYVWLSLTGKHHKSEDLGICK